MNILTIEEIDKLISRTLPNLKIRKDEFIEERELGEKLPSFFNSYDMHFFLSQDRILQEKVFEEFKLWCKERIEFRVTKHYRLRIYFLDYSFDGKYWRDSEKEGSLYEITNHQEDIQQNAVNYYFE